MQKNRILFDQLKFLRTEMRNPGTAGIDSLPIQEILVKINREDRKVALAVGKEVGAITKAVELVTRSFNAGGRLLYVGAGTSGRLGILDATECPPTYGTDPSMVQGIIAGGKKAVFRSQEGAEDRATDGARDIRSKKVGRKDTVCGIAASMRTPYVIGAIEEAKKRGAKTVYVTTNPRSTLKMAEFSKLRKNIDVAICADVGPEVIMGSTRMKSGTAQKLILNMITTASMIRLGKVYGNMMVDLRMTSRKLEERAKRVLMIATGVDYAAANDALTEAGGHVKAAIVMIQSRVSLAEALRRLKKAKGFVKRAITR